jgi:hypothetical protein
MKKALSLLLVLVMCLSLCACGAPKTFEEAVTMAEAKLEEWDSQKYNGYRYTSWYTVEGKPFIVMMIPTLDADGMYTEFVAKGAAEEIYKDISKCFSAVETEVSIMIGDSEEVKYIFEADDFK